MSSFQQCLTTSFIARHKINSKALKTHSQMSDDLILVTVFSVQNPRKGLTTSTFHRSKIGEIVCFFGFQTKILEWAKFPTDYLSCFRYKMNMESFSHIMCVRIVP